MQLTSEQQNILKSTGDIRINAIAGSGKTTTIIEYAASRPIEAKILYLAFNKSVKLEAQQKFALKKLHNVRVETAHSLAYQHIVFDSIYKVRHQGYKTHEIVEILDLKKYDEKHFEFVLANHIGKFVAYFCNSDKSKIQELDYLSIVKGDSTKALVKAAYTFIEKQTRIFLAKMDAGEIEITHDFYLKKFQLSQPILSYDYILFDEGQDASPAMLDVFLKQLATKVIVGDTHQQIYSWRYAINSLQKTNFETYNLSSSFRFTNDIAKLASSVLEWKNQIGSNISVSINGLGNCNEKKTKAVLARTNLGLLIKAIEYVVEKKSAKKIYFEGNINSYTYADDGASLYDILNLFIGKKHLIKDSLIKKMKNIEELDIYINKTEDIQLKMMVDIIKEYGKKIPKILKEIKEKHIDTDNKSEADFIFSTVHRAKGMEYDIVHLVNDFMDENQILKLKENHTQDLDFQKINEEINLLYVAITRTRNKLFIPNNLLPHFLAKSKSIQPLFNKSIEENSTGNSNYFDEIKKTHNKAYEPWSNSLDENLVSMFYEGVSIKDMSSHFGRTTGAIRSRIKKLNLEK